MGATCGASSPSLETEEEVNSECQATTSVHMVQAAPQRVPQLPPVEVAAAFQGVPEPLLPPTDAQTVSQDPAGSTSQNDSSPPGLVGEEPTTTVTPPPVEPPLLQQSTDSQQICTGAQQPLPQEQEEEPQASALLELGPDPHPEEGKDALPMPSRQATAMSGRTGPQQPQSRPGSAARSCASDAPKSRQLPGIEDGCRVSSSRQTSHFHAGKGSVPPSRQASHCNAGEGSVPPSRQASHCHANEGSVLPSKQASHCNAGEGSVPPSRQASHCHANEGSVLPSRQTSHCNAGEGSVLPSRQASHRRANESSVPLSRQLSHQHAGHGSAISQEDDVTSNEIVSLRREKVPLPTSESLAFALPNMKNGAGPSDGGLRALADYAYETNSLLLHCQRKQDVDQKQVSRANSWSNDPFHGWRKEETLTAVARSFSNLEGNEAKMLYDQVLWQHDPFHGWNHGLESGQPKEAIEKLQKVHQARQRKKLPAFNNVEVKRFQTNKEYSRPDPKGKQLEIRKHWSGVERKPVLNAQKAWQRDAFFGWLPGRGFPQELPVICEDLLSRQPTCQHSTTAMGESGGVQHCPMKLSLRVIAAHNLVNMDTGMFGDVSDPYVKFWLGSGSEQESQKTPTINNDLNPVWNAGPFNFKLEREDDVLHFEVYDEDTFTSDDLLGRLAIPLLDMVHGDPDVPVRIKEQLRDTKHGELEVEITLSPLKLLENVGSAAVPDAARQISSAHLPSRQVSTLSQKSRLGGGAHECLGKISLRVISAHNLVNMDTGIFGDVSDPYVKFWLGSGSEKESQKTPTINNDLNPVWNAGPFSFTVGSEDDVLHLEVYDEDTFTSDDLLGRLAIPLLDIVHGEPNVAVPIKDQLKDTKHGELEIEITFSPTQLPGQINSETMPDAVRQVSLANVSSRQVSIASQKSGFGDGMKHCPGMLSLRVIAAHNLVNMDTGMFGDVSDPYVKFWLGSGSEQESQKTPTINNDLNPRWNAGPFNFTVEREDDVLHLEVYDEDTFTSDDLLGRLTIPVFSIVHGEPNAAIWIRDQLEDIEHGELEIELSYCPEVFMGA